MTAGKLALGSHSENMFLSIWGVVEMTQTKNNLATTIVAAGGHKLHMAAHHCWSWL